MPMNREWLMRKKRLYKQLSQEKKKKDKVLHMHRWMRYAAILAVALLMGGGAGYWFYNRPEHQMLVAVANEGIVKEVVLRGYFSVAEQCRHAEVPARILRKRT